MKNVVNNNQIKYLTKGQFIKHPYKSGKDKTYIQSQIDNPVKQSKVK